MYNTSDLKPGLIVDFEDAPHVVDSHHASDPKARNATVIHKVRLRNLVTGQKVDKSFRSGEMFAVPDFQKRKASFLFRDAESLHFMDSETYDQFALPADLLVDESRFLVENMVVTSLIYRDHAIGLELPPKVVLEITETNPAVKGNSARARNKPATLETGHVVQVPEHIAQGETISVDTRTGEFLGRAQKA